MRTRKPFFHEDGFYDGVSRIPEPREIHSKAVISMNDSYDWYPEKDSTIKTETRRFEESIDAPLGEEYKLKSQIDHYSISNTRDAYVLAAI